MQIQTGKNTEIITDSYGVTDSYESQGLEWLSIFKAASCQTSVTNRNSSVETVTKTPQTVTSPVQSPTKTDISLQKSETGIPGSNQNLRKPTESRHLSSKVVTKWHSRNIRLWLGTTTKDGVEYRTLEYEADKPIPSKWLKELEAEKHDIQLALVAQEVRNLSARYWESRKEEVEAARIEKAQYPEAFEQRPIDWPQIAIDRAMQDALATKLGPLKAIQAILRASNEILSLWATKARKESPEAIQRAALELLCMRHEIVVDNEIADGQLTDGEVISNATEFPDWYLLSEDHFPTEDDYFETAIVIEGKLKSLGNAFIRASTGKAWMYEKSDLELEWDFTHWRHYEDDNEPVESATDSELEAIQTPVVKPREQGRGRRKSDADLMREIVEVCTAAKREAAERTDRVDEAKPAATLSLELEMFGDNKR